LLSYRPPSNSIVALLAPNFHCLIARYFIKWSNLLKILFQYLFALMFLSVNQTKELKHFDIVCLFSLFMYYCDLSTFTSCCLLHLKKNRYLLNASFNSLFLIWVTDLWNYYSWLSFCLMMLIHLCIAHYNCLLYSFLTVFSVILLLVVLMNSSPVLSSLSFFNASFCSISFCYILMRLPELLIWLVLLKAFDFHLLK